MIDFRLRDIPKAQLDELGKVFFESYVAGNRNPIFKSLTLRIAGEVLDRAARLPIDGAPIELNVTAATPDHLEQARKFFQCARDDTALGAARYRRSREFFSSVLCEITAEQTHRESERDHV